jgi:major facilitator superfamily transporter permease
MMFSLSMIVIFPMTGWLIDCFGFDWTFIALGGLLLATTPFLYMGLKKISQNLQEV